MEGHTFISWNVPNVISIWLMVGLGAVAAVVAMKYWRNRSGASA